MNDSIRLLYRVFRSLFVALAVGLGWGIRGDFGHELGAAYPGAALGLAFAYVSGQASMFKWMPYLGAAGALGISLGGAMSYGILHGYAQSDTFLNYSYGFFTLLLEGGAWGCGGGVLIGLLLEKQRLRVSECLSLAATTLLIGALFYYLIVHLIGFHINPPRNDLSIGFTGGVLGLLAWLIDRKKWYATKGAVLGFVGFGIGMALGRLLGNASTLQPFPVNYWNIMECSVGFIGGFIFTFGMLGKEVAPPPDDRDFRFVGLLSCFGVMAIPLFHLLGRIEIQKKLGGWSAALAGYGYANPDERAQNVLRLILAVCAVGLVAAYVWSLFWRADKTSRSAFPVLILSLLMILFQNLNALYFWYPRQPNTINMHFMFWIFLALMLLYAMLRRHEPAVVPDEEADHINWFRYIGGTIAAYLVIIYIAGFVNGPTTMPSANTRWPVWVWKDGPFPRDQEVKIDLFSRWRN
ncbi:MAG: hypothetical protein HYZ00_08060 [Candidatus Hydrogenedentes bacterium]|nr:hypothetical protein [Candidatus Hydrogenedentota bacterium]